LLPRLVQDLRAVGVDAPVVVGGIIPDEDQPVLTAAGIAAVYTPKDYDLVRIMDDICDVVVEHRGQRAPA